MMRGLLWRLTFRFHAAWRRWRYPPIVVIERSGQATNSPKVHVSVWGVSGTQGVYTWDATEQGEACATMYGNGLAEIIQRRVVDKREREHE